jgi:hypothetical protein
VIPRVTMRAALADNQLLGGVLDGANWAAWRTLLVAAMGEKLSEDSTDVMIPRLPSGDSPLARLLFSRPTGLTAGCRCFLFLGIDAGPQRVHQVDHMWRRSFLGGLDLFASLLLFQKVYEGVFIPVSNLDGSK